MRQGGQLARSGQRRAGARTLATDPGVAPSTQNSPSALVESPVERRTVPETGCVSDRVHTRETTARPKLEGPARDNPIAGPRTGTTRSETSAPFLAGANGRHNEPGSRPASACPVQPPSKAGGDSPRGAGRHHGNGKADRSTESDSRGRGAAHQRRAKRHTREAQRRRQPRQRTRFADNNGPRVPQTQTARATPAQPRHARWCQATPNEVRGARHEESSPPEELEKRRRSREAETRKRLRSSSEAETRPRVAQETRRPG